MLCSEITMDPGGIARTPGPPRKIRSGLSGKPMKQAYERPRLGPMPGRTGGGGSRVGNRPLLDY